MLKKIFGFFLFLSLPLGAQTNSVLEETLYHNYKKSIQDPSNQKSAGFTTFEQDLFVTALWDAIEEGSPEALKTLDLLNTFNYALVQKLRLSILKIKYLRATTLPQDLQLEIINALKLPEVDLQIIYLLASYEEELLAANLTELIALARTHPRYNDIQETASDLAPLAQDALSDLFYRTPDVSSVLDGKYAKAVKLFMFCRKNRRQTCLMVMKDINGKELRKKNGTLWNRKSLTLSAKNQESHITNGNTPMGILTIDSVMPKADEPLVYGKYRRIILNFIPKTEDEALMKSFLPESSHAEGWWKPSTLARDVGRGLLRIHGTGRINKKPSTPYFPFTPTNGCIAQRENTYNGITYKDQRILLDTIMGAMNLKATFENEKKVKGVLYLVELDDKESPVTLEDLALKGIE